MKWKRFRPGDPFKDIYYLISKDKYKGPDYNIYDSFNATRNGEGGVPNLMWKCENQNQLLFLIGLINQALEYTVLQLLVVIHVQY